MRVARSPGIRIDRLNNYERTVAIHNCHWQNHNWGCSTAVRIQQKKFQKPHCFCCLYYQIYPHNTTVSVASTIRYTRTILLFLLPVLSDIPPQYYCFFRQVLQIKPHNITASVDSHITYNPKKLLFSLPVLLVITPKH